MSLEHIVTKEELKLKYELVLTTMSNVNDGYKKLSMWITTFDNTTITYYIVTKNNEPHYDGLSIDAAIIAYNQIT